MTRAPTALAFVRDRLTPGQRYGLGLTLALVAAGLAFWGFLEIVESWTRNEDVYRVDGRAAGLAQTAFLTAVSVFHVLTYAGSAWVTVPLVLAAAAGLWRRGDRPAVLLLVTAFGAGEGLLYGLKALFHRARPELQLVAEHGHSFPSGHSFTAALVYGLLAVLAWRWATTPATRVGLALACVALALLAGTSRIVLGVHYATDVLGGFVLAARWLAASLAVARFVAPVEALTDPLPDLSRV